MGCYMRRRDDTRKYKKIACESEREKGTMVDLYETNLQVQEKSGQNLREKAKRQRMTLFFFKETNRIINGCARKR